MWNGVSAREEAKEDISSLSGTRKYGQHMGRHEAMAAGRHIDWCGDGGPAGTRPAERPVGLNGAQVHARGGDFAGAPWASPIQVHCSSLPRLINTFFCPILFQEVPMF
jgi:hypothetical protein